jgi:hypothetical protein
MVMTQEPPAVNDVPQVFVCVNSLAFVPVTVMPLMFRLPGPKLAKVVCTGALTFPTVCLTIAKQGTEIVGTGVVCAAGSTP